MVCIGNDWDPIIAPEVVQPYYAKLREFLKYEYAHATVYPDMHAIFNALKNTPFSEVKVVILGQDPYHEPGQAQGLCFYVPPEIQAPPSLVNIAKELGHMPNLLSWTDQGVLLLNATLTVEAHKAGSHQGKGWEVFTDAVIHALASERENLVFILWGSYAQKKGAFIDETRHCVIKSAHPSPLSAYRGFFGSQPFAKANAYLQEHGQQPIEW